MRDEALPDEEAHSESLTFPNFEIIPESSPQIRDLPVTGLERVEPVENVKFLFINSKQSKSNAHEDKENHQEETLSMEFRLLFALLLLPQP